MPSTINVQIKVSHRWWLLPYLELMIFFCWLMDCDPNYDKLERVIKRGLKTKVVK